MEGEQFECPACGFRGQEEEFNLTNDEQIECPDCQDATIHDIGHWYVED